MKNSILQNVIDLIGDERAISILDCIESHIFNLDNGRQSNDYPLKTAVDILRSAGCSLNQATILIKKLSKEFFNREILQTIDTY